MGKEWRFSQLGGSRRTLTLAGASAPHGRPRKGPVVSDGVKLRRTRVYYPGDTAPPTTHIFGTQWTDWELKGRFSDVHLGPGGTKKAIREWQSFVGDAQPVLVQWGDVLTAYAIVDSFIPDRESEFECAYALVLLVDSQLDAVQMRPPSTLPKAPLALCQALQVELDANIAAVPSLPSAGDLKPDFLDSLEELVSGINGFSAALLSVAGDIDAFVDATFDQLERLRAGVAQMRTAVHRLRSTVEATENDAALLARASDTEVQWFATRTGLDVSTMRILALLEQIDREAELVRRGRILSVYVAQLGDTWESIATQFFGGPSEAGRLRDANGITYGALPVPGREYQIPVAG